MSDGNIWCGECSAVVPFRNLDGGIGECVDCGSRFPIPATRDPFEQEVAKRIAQQIAELTAAPMPEYGPENFQPSGLTEGHPSLDEGIKEEEHRPEGLTEFLLDALQELRDENLELWEAFNALETTVSSRLLGVRPLRRGPAEPSPPVRPGESGDDLRWRSSGSRRSEGGEAVCGQSGKGARIPLPGGPYYEDESVDHEHDPVPPPKQLHEAGWKCGQPMPGTLGERDKECESQRGSPDGALGDNHPYSS